MSEWAYRTCEKCGTSVHLNTKCNTDKCNGDPWNIAKVAAVKIRQLIIKKGELKKEILNITALINELKKEI